jgi:uncharacterized protein (DUF2252 family)
MNVANSKSARGKSVKTYDGLQEPYVPVERRYEAGKALRARVPLEKHSGWIPGTRRSDPIQIIIESNRHRVAQLVPIRYARMLTSAFAFLRGAAAVMASDLSHTPVTGLRVQACGDCHLMNFGAFATPERRLVFDINDFDETLPAPWEWDVKRLAASFVVGARHIGFTRVDAESVSHAAVRSYRKWMAQYARMNLLDVWYDYIDLEQLIKVIPEQKWRTRMQSRIAKARAASAIEHDFPKLATHKGDRPRIRDNPPLIFHLEGQKAREYQRSVTDAHRKYLESLAPNYRVLISRFKLYDIAMKVVGVGSVGTLCLVALLMASDSDPLFIQIKEAGHSVLEPYAGASEYRNHGERVVVGQRMMQAASDMLLGWTHARLADRDFYVRQLRDMKISITMEAMDKTVLKFYGETCGRVLARAHARSGDAAMIAGYMGTSSAFEEAATNFAAQYADQTDHDYAALVEAVRSGRLEAAPD